MYRGLAAPFGTPVSCTFIRCGHAASIASLDAGLLGQHARSLETIFLCRLPRRGVAGDHHPTAVTLGLGPWDGTPGWDPGMGPWDGTLGFRVWGLGFALLKNVRSHPPPPWSGLGGLVHERAHGIQIRPTPDHPYSCAIRV